MGDKLISDQTTNTVTGFASMLTAALLCDISGLFVPVVPFWQNESVCASN